LKGVVIMLSWVDVNFKVLINSEDEEELRNTINNFLYELNSTSPNNDYIELDNKATRIGGVSEVTYTITNMEDKEFEDILKEYLNRKEEDNNG
jgi:hypothetical protein